MEAKQIIHYPNLKTVLAVEEVLKNAELAMSRTEIKSKLKQKIMHQTLNVILSYLEEKGLIYDGSKGVLWTYNPSEKLATQIREARRL